MKKAVISDLKGVALDVTITLDGYATSFRPDTNPLDGVIRFVNVHTCRTLEFKGVTFLHIVCPDGSVTRINLNHVVLYDVHEHGKDVEGGEPVRKGVTLFDYSDYIYGEEDSDDERTDDHSED